MRCADFESSCVSVKEVGPGTMVAATTASTMIPNKWICFLPITSSTRYFVEPGRIIPATRLMAISANPAIRIQRRGLISAQISGSELQSIFFFFLAVASGDGTATAGVLAVVAIG